MNPIRNSHDNGQLMSETWWVEGKRHRVDGPAWQEWDEDGQFRKEGWWVDGMLHRFDGPALQQWHKNGQLFREEWWIHGKIHRLDGPAWQQWTPHGQLWRGEWWIDAEEVEPVEDPLAWALWVAKNFGNVHGLEKFCLDNIGEKAASAILASSKLL